MVLFELKVIFPYSYTASVGTNSPSGQNAYTRRPMILSSSFGLGRPTGAYDPQRPDGPDYSTASKVDNPAPPSHTFSSSSKNPSNPVGIPLNIGLDVYPIGNHKNINLNTNRKTQTDDNHQVKIHLNLLSSKPHQGQTSSQSFSIGPFSYNG